MPSPWYPKHFFKGLLGGEVIEGFIHPALAWGALLAGVPLLIHLLNRQRHRPVPWAAMRFVLAAYKRTRRRAQFENLLLLLLRMAAVALLAFAVARPFTGERSPLVPFTESRRDIVLVLDASGSTGYREGVQSVFEAILERARSILTDLDSTRGDRVRLIHAARTADLIGFRSPEEALASLTTLSAPTDDRLDLASVLNRVAQILERDAGSAGTGETVEVRLLSDLQRSAFFPAAGEALGDEGIPALQGALDRLEELGCVVVVEDLGAAALQPPNLGIEELEPADEILGPGLTSDFRVRVRNWGAQGRAAVRVVLEVDGVRLPSQRIDVDARSSAEALFPVSFRDSGYHTVTAALEGDRLGLDDRSSSVVWVPPPLRCLLVNGDPAPEIERDELGYLLAALEPPGDDLYGGGPRLYAPFVLEEVAATQLSGDEDVSAYDVLLLANVSALSPRWIERIEQRVASGAALIITAGDRLSTPSAQAAWNARFWAADGTGLSPVRWTGTVSVPDRRKAYFRVSWFQEDHPALAFFSDETWRPFLTEVPIFGFVKAELAEGATDVRVLARLDDEAHSPLLIERPYDRGKVLLWATSIDDDWTRIPEIPATLVPLAHELIRYAGRGSRPPRNARVGTPLTLEFEAFPRNPTLVRPDGSRHRLDGEPEEVAKGIWRLPAIADTDRAGLWRVESEGAPPAVFAIQCDPREGDLERVPPEELEASHPAWRFHRPADDARSLGTTTEGTRGELWRFLAAATLAALILETLWAAWIGQRRRATR